LGNQVPIIIKLVKIILNIIFGSIGILLFGGFHLFTGFGIASVVYPSDPFLIILSYLFFYGLFAHLIIRAEIPGNDGLNPFQVALMTGWVSGAITTGVIFLMMSVSITFLIINVMVFVTITTILALKIQRNDSNYYWTRTDGSKVMIKKNVFLASNTLNVYSWAGFLTIVTAVTLFKWVL
jgi:hypothetical protein